MPIIYSESSTSLWLPQPLSGNSVSLKSMSARQTYVPRSSIYDLMVFMPGPSPFGSLSGTDASKMETSISLVKLGTPPSPGLVLLVKGT